MPILVVGKEKSLAAVATRMLTARASKSAHADAVNALRAANPGIDHDRLQPGTVLVVPEVADARVKIEGAHDGSVTDLTEQVKAALAGLADAVDGHTERDSASRERTARAVGAAELKRAAARDPELRTRLAELGRTVKADAKSAAAEADALRATLRDWTAAVEAVRPAEH
jgi:hypothetical protein